MVKVLNAEEWKKIRMTGITEKEWEKTDGLDKVKLIERAGIDLRKFFPTFGTFPGLTYPQSLFPEEEGLKEKVLSKEGLLFLNDKAENEGREIGGVIKDGKIKVLFKGDENKIDLTVDEMKEEVDTLFHTHIKTGGIPFDPPSVSDIINYLSLQVKFYADALLGNGDKKRGGNRKVKNGAVFAYDEIYVYYISYPLMKKIKEKLKSMWNSRDHEMFIYNVEKLMEHLEISTALFLSSHTRVSNPSELKNYMEALASIGILLKRYRYNDKVVFLS